MLTLPQESWNGNYRYQWDAHVSQQDLAEYYTPSFQSCARDSNVGSFMCSYNALNGVPTCADPYLLQTILREHWGWTNDQQYVTSDCDAIQNIFMPHEYRATRVETVAAALLAGTDLNCGTYYQENLPKAYAQGLFNESALTQALVRQYSALVRLGYFDGTKVPYRSIGWKDVNTNASQQLAYKAAAEGITLLKNDGMLPMKITKNMTVLIVGSWANATVCKPSITFSGSCANKIVRRKCKVITPVLLHIYIRHCGLLNRLVQRFMPPWSPVARVIQPPILGYQSGTGLRRQT